ncbi:cytochrome oxidase c subunit VIb-domain-containing protein [Auriculariales sp. MPI-PUGE-AT-0066]|nr:cytochrome oxidase c subunit VIb-domain-containing protein [Auriculariales sp. MPI-PUGE-AT-0066]
MVSLSPKPEDALKPAQQKPEIPRREQRNMCYEAKDAYYACLDAAGVLTPGTETDKSGCAELKRLYEERCQKSWVQYFNTRRVLAEEQREILASQRAQEQAYMKRNS